MNFSVCLEFIYPDVPIEGRIRKVKDLGFDAGEIWGWRNRDLETIRRECSRCGFSIVSICATEPYAGLSDPEDSGAAVQEIRDSIEAAQFLGCEGVIVMAGKKTSVPHPEANIADALRSLASPAERAGVTLLLEALNSLEWPDYYLDESSRMLSIVSAVGRRSVRALFDFYHLGLMEGNLVETARNHIDLIGRFHVAGVPGRHEPESGELNYPAILASIDAAGFTGFVGLEYSPQLESGISLQRTIRWIRGALTQTVGSAE